MLLGLGSGAVYAALGLGIVLAYRGSGVISFAHGAMAMLAVYTYAELRSTGDLVVPVPGLPDRIHVAAEVPLVPALFVALGVSALLGFLVHLVFRPLRNAPALAKVVASVGIMLVLQAVVLLRFGTKTRSLAPILPDEGVDVLGVTIPRDRFWLAGLAVLLGIALWALFLHTRFGLATRASAENEKGAILLGLSPDRIAAANWVMASMVAGLVGILVAPVTGVDPLKFTLLVVPALGAALVGRFSSFGWTVAGGLALGAGQSVITKLQTDYSWVPRVGVKEGLPFLVVIAVLFVVGRRLPDRASLATAQLPVAPSPRRLAITASASVATGTAAMLVLRGGYRFGLIVSLVVAVVCLSLVVLTGYVGQISLAQMALAGIAGFALSKLADGAGIPFPFSPLLAVALATAIGILVGIPALRVRGVNLAVVTLAAGVALEEFVFKNPDYTGGFDGAFVPSPSLFGLDLGIRGGGHFPRPAFGIFVLLVLTALALVVANLRRGPGGRRMLAVRADERAAAAVGVSVTRTKLAAFALSAFLAGVGGVLIGYQRIQLSATSFGVFVSLGVLAAAYVGGITSVSGAVVGGLLAGGGIVYTALDRWVGFGEYELLFNGLGLLVVAVLYPEGVAGAARAGLGRLRRAVARPAAQRPDQATAAEGPLAGEPTPPAPDPFVPSGSAGPLLEAEGVQVRFAGLQALREVGLTLPRGELVGLIGPNGAGKTTLIDALTGFVPLSSGRVRLAGREVQRLGPDARARLGLARTFQSLQLFEDLTVEENLMVAAERPGWWNLAAGLVVPRRGAEAHVGWALDLVGLTDIASRMPRELSHGERKLVAVARAVAARPEVLLLDEPAAGLDTWESELLGRRLRTLVEELGVAILLVDHDMGLVLGVCDSVHVLDFGQVIASGPPASVRQDPAVLAAYLGGASPPATPAPVPTERGSL